MKWKVFKDIDWVQLGRGCTKCKDSGSEEEKKKQECKCESGGACTGPEKCKCALAGKCCKCYCTGCSGKCSEKAKCSCSTEEDKGTYKRCRRIYNDSYQSVYSETVLKSFTGETTTAYRQPMWKDLIYLPDSDTPSHRRHQCAQILLGSVCLIWSGLTYMHWTGKWAKGSPYWNNHILDGSGLDDGTLSQWLQALGFPREMLNDKGPKNRLDQVIWDGFRDMLFLGFLEPSGLNTSGVSDTNGNTARSPFGMNYAGFIHTAHRDSFNTDQATVFNNGTSSSSAVQISESNQHKNGAIFKLYILSCAYFTGLQKKTTHSTPRTPKTIREILYWLSALPYSPAYPMILTYGKDRLTEVLKKPEATDSSSDTPKLSFLQQGRPHPITVDEYNLFAHFQAVTQYCPLVLIGIQGGLHSATKGTTPAIHSLYANNECHFTYPSVPIQAYNQVVHYIRGLFYQLYFLRKQCAVKVTCGGKWRECRYGKDVVSKGVISWMCLGCSPMEHDRKCRVGEMEKGVETVSLGKPDDVLEKLKAVLVAIGYVVVQLGNAQEALEKGEKEGIYQSMVIGLVEALGEVVGAVKDVVDKHKSMPLGELKGALEKVIEVVLVVVDKLVEGVEKKKVTGKRAQKALEGAMGKLGRLNRKLYVVLGMNIGLVGKVGKGALEAGRLEVIAANHALQGATLKKLDRSLKNINRLY